MCKYVRVCVRSGVHMSDSGGSEWVRASYRVRTAVNMCLRVYQHSLVCVSAGVCAGVCAGVYLCTWVALGEHRS